MDENKSAIDKLKESKGVKGYKKFAKIRRWIFWPLVTFGILLTIGSELFGYDDSWFVELLNTLSFSNTD